jgi:hypothetical protein
VRFALTLCTGPYYWSGSLAGRLGRFPPFLVGWVSLVAFLGGLATYSLQAMQQVVSLNITLLGVQLTAVRRSL